MPRFSRLTAAWLMLPIAAALVGTLAMRWALNQRRVALGWVSHSHEVIGEARDLERQAVESEKLLLHYSHHGQPEDLAALREQVDGFEDNIGDLRRLVNDNPSQRRAIDAIRDQYKSWLASVSDSLSAAPIAPDAAHDLASNAATGELRKAISAFIVEEQRLLELRQARTEDAEIVGDLGTAGALVGIIVCILLVMRAVTRAAHDLGRLVDATEAFGAGDLSARAPALRRPELGAVSRAFNRMADRLAQREQEAALMNRLGESLHACMEAREAAHVIERIAPALLPSTDGCVYLYAASRDQLVRDMCWGREITPTRFTPGECWATRRARRNLSGPSDPLAVPCAHVVGHAGPALCVPLAAHGDMMGVLHVRSADSLELNEERLRLVALFSESVALSLANLRLRETLRHQAIRDGLTGLFNRRYMEETLSRELARVGRQHSALSLLIFDVDHFKRYNDEFGHAGGDALLRALAQLTSTHFRTSDVVCRYGGEEFVVVMPDADAASALARAASLREAAALLRVRDGGQLLGPVTISGGVASAPEHAEVGEELIRLADRALYESKRSGRNRMTVTDARAGEPAPPLQ